MANHDQLELTNSEPKKAADRPARLRSKASTTRRQDQYSKFGVLSLIEAMLRSRYYPKVPQIISAVILGVILFFAFTGSPHGETNLGVVVTWYIWWVLLPFTAVVFGRIWCALCPISAISRALLRFRKPPGRFGESTIVRHGVWVSGALLLFLSWIMIAWRIEAIPSGTGMLLLAFTASAVVVGLLFSERTWCKALCPIGLLVGLYSRLAPLQLRPTGSTCAAKCGRAGVCHAAPLSEECLNVGPISKLSTNRSCSLCGECVKSCRHSSLELRFAWPEALAARASITAGEAVALLIVLSVVLLDLLRMTSWYPLLMKLTLASLPWGGYNSALALVMLALAAGLVALYATTIWASAVIAKQRMRETFVLFASPYVAAAVAVHLGSEIFHLVNHGTRPALAIAMELGIPVDYPAVVRGAVYVQNLGLQIAQNALVLIAIILIARVFWKTVLATGVSGRRRELLAASQGVLLILVAVAAAFLFISPMGLIH